MEVEEIERKLRFVLKKRRKECSVLSPSECSRLFVVKGHIVVLCGAVLLLDGRKVEENVVYISRWTEKIVATKVDEVLIFDFTEATVKRIGSLVNLKRCDVWMEYLGMLFDDGGFKMFKDEECVLNIEGVRDFVLPDSVVGKDGIYKNHRDVERVFRNGDGSVIVITNKEIILGSVKIENTLHKGDFEFADNTSVRYYFTSFRGISILATCNSSRFLLLGKDLQELELEEEIKLLGLNTDEEFNTRYLTGMDYSGGIVYLIDEDGVVSEFEVHGIDEELEERDDIEFDEVNFTISGDRIVRSENGKRVYQKYGDKPEPEKDEMLEAKSECRSPLSSLNKLLETAQERKGGMNGKDKDKREITKDPRIDKLLESITTQTDEIIEDFKKIEVNKSVCQMYKYNSNDLSLFTEQVYRNIMKLDDCGSIKDRMIAQLTFMIESLGIYKGMNEENIKSSVRYIDTVIESGSGQRRRAVHYTKPLFYDMKRVRGAELDFDRGKICNAKTLSGIDYIEKKLSYDINDEFSSLEIKGSSERVFKSESNEQDDILRDEKISESQDMPLIANTVIYNPSPPAEQARAEQGFNVDTQASDQQHLPHPSVNLVPSSQTNIFGQPITQQEPIQFGGMFRSSTPSNIFQSIASTSTVLPCMPQKKEDDKSTPNAFSRFANSRNLFK